MTNQKKPQALDDTALEGAQGGIAGSAELNAGLTAEAEAVDGEAETRHPVSNMLKNRTDTAKNSLRNIN
ncbi:MAG: hypothetical protein AAF674_02145 [Pseudomonadota bacterium]